MNDHVDVLIVGAGLSGIGAAHHLTTKLPHKSYAILEARDAIGGTWDLFRYPGIRSDSDMHTLGYKFRPWVADEAIADGPAILDYVRDTARDGDIESHIRFHHRVVRAEWSTPDAQWTVHAERTDTGEAVEITCNFLFVNGGYYHYDDPYLPEFEGVERFGGPFFHAQKWPEDLDYQGKRVVVIGSGATAVTIVPAMADTGAAHVTMLQRTPTYIVSLPQRDPIAIFLRKVLPDRLAYAITRRKNVFLQATTYRLSKRRPGLVRKLIRHGVMRRLPPGYAVDTHFNPPYNPWDQRMCLVPDGDLFEAIGSGRASIVTDRIETFTERGVKLASGDELEADIVVAATGLNLLPLGGIEFSVDGRDVAIPQTMAYKGMMLSGIPNMAFTVGYTNASWTLKADLTCEFVCRLLEHMDQRGHTKAVPEQTDPSVTEEPFLDFSAGYVLRALDRFPKQGSRRPWRLDQNYALDVKTLRTAPIDDGAMVFSTPTAADRPAADVEAAAA
jgi:cation diffusion facilitator CzcD-associated flavoprotein CzcO